MDYVQKNLMSGEEIVYSGEIHWFIYMSGLIVLFFGLCFLIAGAGWVLLLVGLVLTINAFIVRNTAEFVVTNKRVISKVGFIRRSTMELNHSKVESFVIEQGIFGRIFSFGTLVINGVGGGKTYIPMVESPMEFRKKAMETIDL